MNKKGLELIVITGLSGAGRTQAMQSLEDQGFFCVDNLPPTFLVKFAELCAQSRGKVSKAAIVCDLRGGEFFSSLSEALANLEKEGFRLEVLFLDASDETLIRRYKESRRRHPLSPHGRVLDGIQAERQQLEELRIRADNIIDTSDLSAQQLRSQVADLFCKAQGLDQMAVSVISFGFKYGIPMDADLVMDVRFLPNPYYVEALRPLTGEHTLVRDYIFGNQMAQEFMEKYLGLLEYILPNYIKEGKTHLVIGIGCTGGQHRSVAIAERVGQFLTERNYSISVKHRDAKKNQKGGTGR
ncbi:RNase adapter RapZ [Desulfosporosinus sp. BICA1-9]|uniref:RNase adapter RapZ n=1 Tax=Desulfosporosinus sp. BICA1-9 TaxID=1531958 RepID=UPI00054B440E|nr:RNase adapter RapZ [Desulfosporosinus sp. BICA1-9]KJS50384.1 MAG: glmZ(sRNA)-inactivating NTPase [Peptococcaceae bacterium BRH_c23]KJS89574.1 MAG: glmZ(sRNA)-inactivating NTPase [Desulfosporosinus sp. BICA1-9]HBW34812.1 RNase adapter RapZ [Desulfosporosinus sp.]